MHLEAFKNFKSFLQAFRTVLTWMVLGFCFLIALAQSIAEIQGLWASGPLHPNPYSHSMPEQDLANLWSGGHLVRLGHIDWLYTPYKFQEWKESLFGVPLLRNDWIYPPTVLFIGVPLSFLPLPSAFFTWDVVTFVLAVALLYYARLPSSVIAIGLLGPATWRSLLLGQYGVITGALFVSGLVLSERHPIKAGILLGLSTIKPQQGIIAPIAWFGARYWKAISAAAATFAVIGSVVAIWLGPPAWTLFSVEGTAVMREILEATPPTANINTGNTFQLAE